MSIERPYGSWSSPLTAERITAGALRLSQPRLDAGVLYWLEGRPDEGGRQVVVRAEPGASPGDATPDGVNVRTRVHEYGGGDYLVRGRRIFFVDFADQRVYAQGPDGRRPLTPPGSRFADFDLSPDGRWLIAVEERPREGREPENRLVALPASGSGGPARVVHAGRDFVSTPRFAPDGRRLVWTAWDHPNMPWDATELVAVEWREDGPSGPVRVLAGGGTDAIFQPGFAPDGSLYFVSDRTGWWNLYRWRDGDPEPVCPRRAEFGLPQWVFGMSTWACIDDDTLLCSVGEDGRQRLARLEVSSGRLDPVPGPLTTVSGLRVEGRLACIAGASPLESGIYTLDLDSGRLDCRRSALALEIDPASLAVAEAIEFPSEEGRRSHAFLYRPRNALVVGPPGDRPPLLVKSHGGPTGMASEALNPGIQFWAQRGFAVVDVNYAGSTGFGRAYRELLRGRWGVADVEDCVAAARFLADEDIVDPERLAITGGSAGGYTTLCALTFHDAFAAGASHYGIGDLEALARDTHKFEARYLDGLIGPYPEARDLYRERSPIHFTERLSCPVVFFQGLEDRVVPPNQAEAMVAALARRGIPHAYVAFEDEQHGFRRAENIRIALDGELFFYAQVFGFEVDVSAEVRARVALVC